MTSKSSHPESLRVDVGLKVGDYASHCFDFIKLRRNRLVIYSQYIWLLHISDESARPDYGWWPIRGSAPFPLSLTWADETAETIYLMLKSEVPTYSSADDAIRAVQNQNLWFRLNHWGFVLCVVGAVWLCRLFFW